MSDRQYELVYILPPDSTEQQVAELHGQLEAVVSRLHGQIEKTENWGRRRLAYEIAHHKEGFYVLEVINGSGELMPRKPIAGIGFCCPRTTRAAVIAPPNSSISSRRRIIR